MSSFFTKQHLLELGWKNHGNQLNTRTDSSRLKPHRLRNGNCWYCFDRLSPENEYEGPHLRGPGDFKRGTLDTPT